MVKGSDFVNLTGYADVIDGLTDLAEDWATRGTWVVGSNVKYAIYVHEGTSKMEGRPFLKDAVEKVSRQKGDQLADNAESADDLVRMLALEIEGEAKENAPVGETGNLRGSIKAVEL